MHLFRAALVFLLLLSPAAWAQGQIGVAGSILVVDRDALFNNTQFGIRIGADVDRATEALVAENRQIETQLIQEERELTDLRPTLDAIEFRSLADAFDEKVQDIRAAQDAKSDAISTALDDARFAYSQAIIPILADLLRENRAVAMFDKRSVLISANVIDVTERAIERIDARFGEGLDQIGPVATPIDPADAATATPDQ